MSFDTEVLVIGAGMSGLGLAVQIVREYGIRNFELIEKSGDVSYLTVYPRSMNVTLMLSRSLRTSILTVSR